MKAWLSSLSLSQRLLGGLLAISLVVTTVATAATYSIFRNREEQQQLTFLAQYVRERTGEEQAVFEQLRAKQQAAAAALRQRLDHARPGELERAFDQNFPLMADGTRRSRPALVEGVDTGAGDRLYGISAFVGDGARLSNADKQILMAAAYVVRASGEAQRNRFDNFYFVTPANRIVMFAPDHPEKMSFYGRTAPANLDIKKMDLVQGSLPANNPKGVMSCTKLTPLLTDPTHKTLVSACVTPAYVDGRFVGAWAVTVPMGSYFLDAIKDALPGATNMIISQQGSLIAAPGFDGADSVTAPVVARYEDMLNLHDLAKRITTEPQPFGVINNPNGKTAVAYGRIDARWLFLSSLSKQQVAAEASRSALPVLLFGLFAALAQIALTLAWARALVVKPLERLAVQAAGEMDCDDLDRRGDEIGALARALGDERRRSQTLMSGLEERVRERTAELDRANQAKSAFLATMSHELRTPLNGVIALSDLLLRRQTSEEDREMAALIVASGRLLEQVLTDILDFSKIEAGQMALNPEPFDLNTAVRRMAELHRASADAKGIALTWSIDPAASGGVLGDEMRLQQILSNLLSNAVKFTSQGEVRLSITREAEGLRFAVKDTGVGFEPEVGARLFRRFEQADATITRRFGGTGLGLAICASLAEIMGGRIWADSEPGQGSTFSLILPLPAVDLDSVARNDDDWSEAPLTGCRVLLAEDHPANQRVVALVLEPLGVELTIVGDGGLAIAAEAKGEFDLILMDLHMPEVDGLTAIRAIRAAEQQRAGRRTPIIALTADALAEHVTATRAAGADGHISKPIRPDGLIRAVAEALGAGSESPETAVA